MRGNIRQWRGRPEADTDDLGPMRSPEPAAAVTDAKFRKVFTSRWTPGAWFALGAAAVLANEVVNRAWVLFAVGLVIALAGGALLDLALPLWRRSTADTVRSSWRVWLVKAAVLVIGAILVMGIRWIVLQFFRSLDPNWPTWLH